MFLEKFSPAKEKLGILNFSLVFARTRQTFKITKLKKKTPGRLAKSIALKKIAKENKRKRSRPTSIELIT
jgi:hypothetical protein